MDAEKRIKIWMIEKDVRFIDVARALGVHRSTVTNWMKGRIAGGKVEEYLKKIGLPEKLIIQKRKGDRKKCLSQ